MPQNKQWILTLASTPTTLEHEFNSITTVIASRLIPIQQQPPPNWKHPQQQHHGGKRKKQGKLVAMQQPTEFQFFLKKQEQEKMKDVASHSHSPRSETDNDVLHEAPLQ